MSERERFDTLVAKRQEMRGGFFARPHFGRRCFFRHVLTGVGGFFLAYRSAPGRAESVGQVKTKNTARTVIFLFLRGAPSHVDTFDFKTNRGVTPSDFAPENFDGITIPMGLLGNTSRVLDKIAIIRSGLAWAEAHQLAQRWIELGRNPTSATGRIAPHVGSVVAIEKEPERRPGQVFPAFVALKPDNISGAGYFPAEYGPFQTAVTGDGLATANHAPGQDVFRERWQTLQTMDGTLRATDSSFGTKPASMGSLYANARRMMFNPAIEAAFTLDEAERMRYGNTPFGDAVATARKIVEQDQGTRFIQVDQTGWDHHFGIYSPSEAHSIYTETAAFDPAFAALIEDLDASGKLGETLVVACGEFGRTPGQLSGGRLGRDHYQQMFFVLAGGGVKGRTVIGATNDKGGRGPGSFTTEPGWSRDRDIRPEDIEATIYSALGIPWTTVRYDDPLERGFYYVPLAEHDAYAPVHELWG